MVYRAQERPRGLLERVVDVPLPGHYQCLVMQSNVTLYPPAMLARAVHVLRTPEGNVELGRWIGETEPWFMARAQATADFSLMLAESDYLSGGRGLTLPER